MEITINAKKVTVEGVRITYDQVVALAATQWGTAATHSVTYRHRVPFEKLPGERDGILSPGQSVPLSEGMVINAVVTSGA